MRIGSLKSSIEDVLAAAPKPPVAERPRFSDADQRRNLAAMAKEARE